MSRVAVVPVRLFASGALAFLMSLPSRRPSEVAKDDTFLVADAIDDGGRDVFANLLLLRVPSTLLGGIEACATCPEMVRFVGVAGGGSYRTPASSDPAFGRERACIDPALIFGGGAAPKSVLASFALFGFLVGARGGSNACLVTPLCSMPSSISITVEGVFMASSSCMVLTVLILALLLLNFSQRTDLWAFWFVDIKGSCWMLVFEFVACACNGRLVVDEMSASERDLLRLHPPESCYRAGAPVKASNIRCSTVCEKSMLISWKMSEMDFCIC